MAQNQLRLRLRAYAPNSTLIGSLPHPLSVDISVPLNDMPSLTMTYPVQGSGSEMLEDACEVAVEFLNPLTGDYVEHPGFRFINIRKSYDLAARPQTVNYTMPHYGWMLRKARFTNQSLLNAEGKRAFTNATPGTIMKAIIDEAHARANIPGLTYTFSAAVDSAGLAWPGSTVFTGSYDYGQDAWSILDSFVNQGLVDYRFDGRELELYAPDTFLRRDFSGDTGINFHVPVNHLEEPVEQTDEDKAQYVIAIGDGGRSAAWPNNTTGTFPWGKWEEVVNAGGVTSPTMLTSIATKGTQVRDAARTQRIKQIIWKDGLPIPFYDYRPGDMVRVRTTTGATTESARIVAMTISTTDPYNLVTHITLNDRFMDRVIRNERWINRLSGSGGPGVGGGSGSGSPFSGLKQAPPLNANWIQNSTASVRYGPLTYRVDVEGNLHVVGAFHSGIARAAGAYTIFNFPAAYFPEDLYANTGLHVSSADAFKATIRVGVDSLGSVGIATTAAIAANDNFYINAITPRT